MAASSSQGEMDGQTPGDLIIYSLEDLKVSDFKKFQNKLSDFSYGDKPPIPRGKLEKANWVTTKDLLIDTYGEEGALDVTIGVLKLNSLLGPANDLQEKRTQNAKLKSTTTSNKLTGWMNCRTLGDLIIYSLEDLKGSDFKKFKSKLSDYSSGDNLPIPRGKLENADWVTTKELLIDTYGEEGALDVMSEVLTLIGLMGPANDLKKRRTEIATLKTTMASNKRTECKKEYMESMKEEYQRIPEYNARRGETVSLEDKYTKLKLIKGPQIMEENEYEMLNSGKGHLQILKKKSDEYSPTTIQTLFDPDKDGFIPKIVVLQGPAGIGKTMTSRKIMLDWASGNLYKDNFDFVFHLSCRELNTITGPISLVGLLSRTCKMQCSGDLVSILKDTGRELLFIVDGFDELRWTIEKKSEVCHDIFEETHKDLLLQRLFRKQILKESSLIITTRPLALEKLYTLVGESRHVEVMGFTKEDCVKYFHNFFKNENDADKALSLVKDNDVLYPMCTVPIVCWIVCTVLKPQIKQDLDLLQSKTATSVYLLYLKGLIKHHCREQPANTCLKKLCALAKEGILKQKILFEMEDLNRHGLSLSEIESVFLNENLFHLDIDTQTCYSFIHLSVQEFLAALYYVLDEGSGNEEGTTGLGEGTSIPEICKGDSLSIMCKEHPHLALAVRFLFGLLNEKEVKTFSKSTGINISLPARQAMEEWLMGECLLKDSHTGNTSPTYFIEAILCLYETQDKDIIRRIISYSSHLKLKSELKGLLTENNCSKQLCYCLMTCKSLQTLSCTNLVLEPKHLQMLSSLLHGCQELSFETVTSPKYKPDTNPSLEKEKRKLSLPYVPPLDLSWLVHPQSNIRVLRLKFCWLTPSCCDVLRSLLITNRSLISLHLSWNKLKDSGIKLLCEGLRDPGCTLQKIRFNHCQTTLLCCDDLCSAISTNQTLSTLETRFVINEKISESHQSFEGLRRLGCTVEIIRKPCTSFFKRAEVEIKYRRPSLHTGLFDPSTDMKSSKIELHNSDSKKAK